MDEEIDKALLLVRDVKKQVDVLMSTHITQPSSNAVPLEVEEDLAMLKSTVLVWYQQQILEYQRRDSRKLNLEVKNWKMCSKGDF